MFKRGSITLAHVRGAPIRVHWTTPLGAVVFTSFSLSPLVWISFFLLVLVHELGHAACVRLYGYQVTSIEVNGLGGRCAWAGDPTAEWLQDLAEKNERSDAERKRKARAAVEQELKDLDASDKKEPEPLQGEVRKVLDRILGKSGSPPPRKGPPRKG